METLKPNRREVADLHFHLGQSVEPHLLWGIAHEQGIKLPTKDYWEFYDLITLNKSEVTWEDYHNLFHWTELIQSSPVSMERTVYESVTGAYRANNIVLMEPGFNPIHRNRAGERDLDQIILAALRGMEKALIEFPQIRAGLHFMMDRRLPYEINEVIARKAIKYSGRGVVGLDIAGPVPKDGSFSYDDYSSLYDEACEAGLNTTVHTGEDGTAEEMSHVVDVLKLDRVNHGFRCYTDANLMKTLHDKNITLCLCPTSNMKVKFITDMNHMKEIITTLWDNEVKFCFNTDNPSMLHTTVNQEMNMMLEHDILTEDQLDQTVKWAFEATFIDLDSDTNLYL